MLFSIAISSIVKVLSSLCASAKSVLLCIGRIVSWSNRSSICIQLMVSSDTYTSTQRIGYTEFSGLGKFPNLLGVPAKSEPLRIQRVTCAPSSMSRSHRFATCNMGICCVELAVLFFQVHKTKSCKHANQALKRSLHLEPMITRPDINDNDIDLSSSQLSVLILALRARVHGPWPIPC